MARHIHGLVSFVIIAGLMLTPGSGQAQTGGSGWTAPRTADDHPDLQGVWANNAVTPFQRPTALAGRAELTDEELASLKSRASELFALDAGDAAFGDTVFEAALAETNGFSSRDTQTGNYNQFWMVEREWDNRTSLIVEPSSGRIPAVTPAAQKRLDAFAAGRQRHAEWTDDRSLGERCITFGAPRLGAGYNSYYQIFQTANHVVLLMEMSHDARIIPLNLDDASPLDDRVRQWHGDSRGRWEGDTLVVKTTHYADKSYFMGSQGQRQVEERFTRVAPDKLRYEVSMTDRDTWTKPWKAVIFMSGSDDALYEYACHEGNIGMEGILSGARALERAEGEGAH